MSATPLRYSINITLDGCCDHRADQTDKALHRYWAEHLAQDDTLLFGRVTYGMMEEAWRLPATGELDLIDEYEFVVHPRIAGHGPTLFAGLPTYLDLQLVNRREFSSGALALRYVPKR